MRVLVFFALVACAAAAPSYLGPLPYGALAVAPVAVAPLAVAPTIPPGDIQAAIIDAQVKIADQAQLIVDQAREITEKANERQNEAIETEKAKSDAAIWAAEEKQWQALNQVQIAEAKLAASVAETQGASAAAESESAIAEAKSDVKSEITEVKSEEKAELKAVEAEKPAEEEKKDDTIEVKSAAPEAPKAEILGISGIKPAVLPAPIGISPILNFQPYVAPISYQAAYHPYPIAAIPQIPQIYQPAIAVKNVW